MTKKFDRRRFIQTTAAASAAAMFPYIRTSRAAGSLKLAFWDHWVPGANKTMEAICHEWAKKHKVDITIDFITSQGSKLELTIAAEKLAQSGHGVHRVKHRRSQPLGVGAPIQQHEHGHGGSGPGLIAPPPVEITRCQGFASLVRHGCSVRSRACSVAVGYLRTG